MKEVVKRFGKPLQIVILYFFDAIFKVIKLKKVSIVLGVDEIANNTYFLKNIFKENAISVNFSENKFYMDNKYDYCINIKNKYLKYLVRIFYSPYLLAKLSHQSDIFLYFWSTGFCLDRTIDYKFLKKNNKKIVCIFVGSDIRSSLLTKFFYDSHNLDHYVYYLENEKFNNESNVQYIASIANKYCDLIITPTNDVISYLNSEKVYNTFMYTIKNDYFFRKIHNNKILKVLHAPSHPIVKGTPLVRSAIKKLKFEGYKFEYIELINKPNDEVLKLLESSDIVLNQFYAEIPGLFGIEAMSKSNAVLMSAKYELMPKNAKNAWIQTGYWEVYDNLKYLLDNPEKIKEYAQNGYEFVKNNYTEEKVREFYIDTFYEHKIIDDKNIFQK